MNEDIKKPTVSAVGSKLVGVDTKPNSEAILSRITPEFPETQFQYMVNSKQLTDVINAVLLVSSDNYINLCAIDPTGKSRLISKTFNVSGHSLAWLEFTHTNNKKSGIYFSVNPINEPINRKPKKSDIKHVAFAHVDIDPDPQIIRNEGFNPAKEALFDRATELIKRYQPTLIICSGNGLQLFWRHKSPLTTNDGENINRLMIEEFKGDNGTHNADRLMRLPGTINYPSPKKIAKGYSAKPVKSSVIHIDENAFFDQSLFPSTAIDNPVTVIPTLQGTHLQDKECPQRRYKAFIKFLGKPDKMLLNGFVHGTHIPPEGNSEQFMTVLNNMAFYSQKDPALMMDWLLGLPFGQGEWFQTRLKRSDKRVELEIQNAINAQENVYDSNHTSSDPSIYDLSHDDLAMDLGKQYFYENSRYVAKLGLWFIWDGTRWVIDEKARHLSLTGEHLRTKAQELLIWAEGQKSVMSENDHIKMMRYIRQEIKNLKSAPQRMHVVSIIKTDPLCTASPSTFDNNLKILGTPNGTVDLVTGTLTPASRSDYITKLTGCATKSGPPVGWLNFMREIFNGDQELIDFMQRLFGYVLTGLTTEEKLFFFYGTGANGKSKLLETIYFILGDYAKRAPATLLLEQRNEQHPTAMAGLAGARGVFASEIPSGKTWNDQVIKDMTGGDTITARLMRQDFFEYAPHFKLLIAGNHQPRLKNVDESMSRRIVILPFNVTIPPERRDTQLGEKLKAEAGQILNWCIEGAVKYFAEGLCIPESVLNASKEYIKNEDVIGEFIDSRLEPDASKRELNTVFQCYKNWVTSQGYNYPITEQRLRKELKDRGYMVKRSNSTYFLHNMKIKFFN